MTNQRESIRYPCSLFPFDTADLFPEHSEAHPHTENSLHTKSNEPRSGVFAAHPLTCPRCSTTISPNLNWCPACGELLIGASLCYASEPPCSPLFYPYQIPSNDSSANDWQLTNGHQYSHVFGASYMHVESRTPLQQCTSYSQSAHSSVALDPVVNATTLAMASSFNTAFINTSSIPNRALPLTVSEQTYPEYQIAETSSPGSQIESVQSYFGALQIQSGPSTSVAPALYSSTCNQEQSAYSSNDPALHFYPMGFPFTNGSTNGFPHINRQRCISGPDLSYTNIAKLNYLSQIQSSTYSAPPHRTGSSDFTSTVFHNTEVHQPHGMHQSQQNSPNWFYPNTDIQETRDQTHDDVDRHIATHFYGNNLLQCFQQPPHSAAARLHHGTIPRSRSFSSDLSLIPPQSNVLGRIPTGYAWRSSSAQWSARSPVLFSEKPTAFSRDCSDRGSHLSTKLSNLGTHCASTKLSSEEEQLDQVYNQPKSNSRPLKACRSKKKGKQLPTKQRKHRASGRNRITTTCSANGDRSPNSENCSEASPDTEISDDSLPTDHPNWLSLPSELWISIIRFLSPHARHQLALTCRRMSCIVRDPSLWRVIQLNRLQHLTNSALASIGKLRPRDLRFSYCHGNGIGVEGLSQLFKSCGSSLRKLSFVGCTKGLFDSDMTLLLAAKHCRNLTQVDASYTLAVRDHTVIALAKSTQHLLSVKLNGAQHISNFAIQQLVHYHKDTLQRLELFGCFRLNSDIFPLLSACQQLRALAFGHLHHLSSDGLLELVSKLPLLSSLDLRGTQTFSNNANLPHLAEKCPHLEEVVLANMLSVKHESGIAQMLRRLPRLRVLDLCGLVAVGDLTMEALATGCPQLEELDVSCTSVTHTGLFHLTRAPAKCLRCLRISHCHEITKEVLEKLVEACTKLTMLYAYGFSTIKDWSFLYKIRPSLQVVCDG